MIHNLVMFFKFYINMWFVLGSHFFQNVKSSFPKRHTEYATWYVQVFLSLPWEDPSTPSAQEAFNAVKTRNHMAIWFSVEMMKNVASIEEVSQKCARLFVRCWTESASHFSEGFLQPSVCDVFLLVYASLSALALKTCVLSWAFKKVNEQKRLVRR